MVEGANTVNPAWLDIGLLDIGNAETLGPNDSPWLRRILSVLPNGGGMLGQPWCGGAVAWWMQQAGLGVPRHWYRAKAWLDWGSFIPSPVVGAVVVFEREGGGHVGLVVGKDARRRLMVLGGNQGDAVRISPFDHARVAGYRWPDEFIASLPVGGLPVIASTGPLSTNEA